MNWLKSAWSWVKNLFSPQTKVVMGAVALAAGVLLVSLPAVAPKAFALTLAIVAVVGFYVLCLLLGVQGVRMLIAGVKPAQAEVAE